VGAILLNVLEAAEGRRRAKGDGDPIVLALVGRRRARPQDGRVRTRHACWHGIRGNTASTQSSFAPPPCKQHSPSVPLSIAGPPAGAEEVRRHLDRLLAPAPSGAAPNAVVTGALRRPGPWQGAVSLHHLPPNP